MESESELQSAGHYIVADICRITCQTGVLIHHPGVIDHQFDIFRHVVDVANSNGVVPDVGSTQIGSRGSDLISAHLRIGIIPVVFEDQLVFEGKEALNIIDIGPVEFSDVEAVVPGNECDGCLAAGRRL